MKYIMTLVSLFVIDNAIKDYVDLNGEVGVENPLPGGRIYIKKYRNTGAMFNIGEKNEKVIAVFSVLFSVFMSGVFAMTLTTKGNVLLKSGLAWLLGGAYSNTYDRLKRHYVVDYVSFRLPPTGNKAIGKVKHAFETVVFNLSDFGIIIGAMLIMVSELLRNEEKAS